MDRAPIAPTLIVVFTGYLGAGKTTLLIDLLRQLPPTARPALLKNEFGDFEVDSLLIREQPNVAVQEMVNGCLCCVLVGQMKNALEELRELYNPDLIFVETSGSAFPAPIAWQIRQMDQTLFKLEAIVTVVDVVNFAGYEDTSVTAKLQAKYSDLIILNKVELVSARQLDLVIDRVNDLNTDTPKVQALGGHIPVDLVLGLDASRLFSSLDEVLLRSPSVDLHGHHHDRDVDLIQIGVPSSPLQDLDVLRSFLASLPADDVYRVKGVVVEHNPREEGAKPYLINFAFGRWELTPLLRATTSDAAVGGLRLVIMGRGLRALTGAILSALHVTEATPGVKCSFTNK